MDSLRLLFVAFFMMSITAPSVFALNPGDAIPEANTAMKNIDGKNITLAGGSSFLRVRSMMMHRTPIA